MEHKISRVFLYEDAETLKEYKNVLQKAMEASHTIGKGITFDYDKRYDINDNIVLFVYNGTSKGIYTKRGQQEYREEKLPSLIATKDSDFKECENILNQIEVCKLLLEKSAFYNFTKSNIIFSSYDQYTDYIESLQQQRTAERTNELILKKCDFLKSKIDSIRDEYGKKATTVEGKDIIVIPQIVKCEYDDMLFFTQNQYMTKEDCIKDEIKIKRDKNNKIIWQ